MSVVVVVLTACGGGSGGTTTTSATDSANGIAQLGYISGGNVKLFELTNLSIPIATTTSSASINSSEAGRFTFENISLNSSNYYLVKISGGVDIDPNDDGVIGANEEVDLNGSAYALAKGSDFLDGNVRINAFSDMAYQKLKGSLGLLGASQIDTALEASAKEYLFDVDGDGKVDHKDILAFDPTQHIGKTKKSYSDILDIYVPKLHSGESDEIKLAALMYIDNPKIVIENGNLQEVPFVLKATIENVPESVSVEWYIHSIKKSSINETISEDGVYQIIAELLQGGTVLKTVSAQVIATKKVEIASIDVDVTKDNMVFVTDESNSSLMGTQITIPKGALVENRKIIVKKSSVNIIPSVDGIGISDVIVMEPSGLTFDKPVQIRLPYNQNVDLTDKTVRIARYSEGGEIDYIVPLFVDETTHEVVFETDHFTEFKAEKYLGLIYKAKPKQEEILRIESDLPGLYYSVEEWVEILNSKLGQKEFTVYDLYLQYKLNSDVALKIKSNDYRNAYKLLFGDTDLQYGINQSWRDIADSYRMIKNAKDTADTISGNLNTIFITKKYLLQIGSNLGLNLSNNPMSFVTDYTTHVFNQGLAALEMLDNTATNEQIELYFTTRDQGYSHQQIIDALKASEGKNQAEEDLGSQFQNGWFYDSGYEFNKIASSLPAEGFWERTKLLYETHNTFNDLSNNEHINNLKNVITDIKTLIDSGGAYIDVGTCTKSFEKYRVFQGEDIVMNVNCGISSSGEFEVDFEIRKDDGYFGTRVENIEVKKIDDDNYKISFKENSLGKSYFYISSAKFTLNSDSSIRDDYYEYGNSQSSVGIDIVENSSDSKGTGYTINGMAKNNVPAMININLQSELQLNLGDNSERVQIGTKYRSKEDLDNDLASKDGTIILSNENCNLAYTMLEKNGLEFGNIDNISVSVTKNSDGSYNFSSEGNYVTDNYTVTRIHGMNVKFNDMNGYGTPSGMPVCEDHGETSNGGDLASLIVGKTLYRRYKTCNNEWMNTMTFHTSGEFEIMDLGTKESGNYKIEGDVAYINGGEHTLPLTEHTADYIKFGHSSDDIFYFTREKAETAPVVNECYDNNGGDGGDGGNGSITVVSKSVSPSPIRLTEQFTVYLNTTTNLSSDIKIRISFSTDTSKTYLMLGGPKNWGRPFDPQGVGINSVGQYTVQFKAYKNDFFYQNLGTVNFNVID